MARVALLLGSVLLSLLGLELGLRVFWDGYYLKGGRAYAEPHPTRGWANVPSTSVEYGDPEFAIRATHNALGFRGPEVGPRDPGRQRVLLLGDSFTYGIGVEDDETLSARLEQLAPSLEVLNTGVNGYGTGQELLLLQEEGERLEPDVVVLAFFWNDVANNVERANHRFRLVDGRIVPPDVIDVRPSDRAKERRVRRRWLRHSYLYRFASDRLKMARFRVKEALGVAQEDGDRLPPERREAAWELEWALLREMRATVERLGARFLLVIVPEQVQVQPDTRVLGLVEADYDVQGRLVDFASAEDIPVLDLLPALHREYERTGTPLYYRWDRHLRPPGVELAAREIADALRELGWLTDAPR
jgi:lysophospholipase L1-like esterase